MPKKMDNVTNQRQMHIRHLSDFNLKYTLESGQSFRWNRVDDAYYGVVEGQILRIQQSEGYFNYRKFREQANFQTPLVSLFGFKSRIGINFRSCER